MNEKEAIVYFKNYIKVKKEVIKERQKEGLNADSKYTQQLEEMVEAFETVLNLLEKKDKIIDELEYIFYNYQLCEYELTDCTYRKCEYIADDEIPHCKECIKQYFESIEYKLEEDK